MNISNLITQISIWIILLPLIAGLLLYKRLDKDSKLIFGLVLLATPPQLLTAFIDHTPFRESFYNLYTIGEFILTYLFVGKKLQYSVFKVIALSTLFLFFILVLTETFTIGISKRFLNEWVCVADISYLIWILLYVLESAINDTSLPNIHNPLFWYLAGLILYTPCTIFVFALYYNIEKSQYLIIKNLWIIQGIFNTILYSFYAVGLYQNRRIKEYAV